ncbi:hypothetical protein [Vibrio owensii]|uniref:hypothetical protein n=1 Tax=Vibrio owensii TaxID=696485 RepID=UPI003DA146E8
MTWKKPSFPTTDANDTESKAAFKSGFSFMVLADVVDEMNLPGSWFVVRPEKKHEFMMKVF